MDRNFDRLAARLKRNIYSSDKGTVRLALLKHDMLAGVQEIASGRQLQILDAGGGMGQISRWLAGMGHQIVLCDISAEMLGIAAAENELEGLQDQITIIQAPLQDLPALLPERKFDLILLHGVIEWMQEPFTAIEALTPMLVDTGAISLLYFNRNKLILKWGINGQIDKATSGLPHNPRQLTPSHPLSEADLAPVFMQYRLTPTSKAGIRIFYGFFSKLINKQVPCHASIDLEKQYCYTEPFASLGEHTHYILRKSLHETNQRS